MHSVIILINFCLPFYFPWLNNNPDYESFLILILKIIVNIFKIIKNESKLGDFLWWTSQEKKKNIESIVGSKCSVPLNYHDYI